jgi:hypothetical protein
MYIPSFIKTWFRHSEVEGRETYTHTQGKAIS